MHPLICLILIVLLIGSSSNAAEKEPSKPLFADKNLEKAVRKSILEKRDNEEPLTEADVSVVSVLHGAGMGITNLAGLELCRSIALIDLSANKISDLTPLRGLVRLQSLTLRSNAIVNLEPLSTNLPLQYLDLSHNKITNVKPLSGLTNLTSLHLSNNQITDIIPLVNLPKLWSLYLADNRISKLPATNNWRSLTALSLSNNRVTDIRSITNLTRLNYLFLENNRIRNLGAWPIMNDETKSEFLPFLNLFTEGNSLNRASRRKLEELKEIGVKVNPQ